MFSSSATALRVLPAATISRTAADSVAQIHRHGHGITARFAQGRRDDLDDPESESDLGQFAQSNRRDSIHTLSSFSAILSVLQYSAGYSIHANSLRDAAAFDIQ
jgi:hypothetical protein